MHQTPFIFDTCWVRPYSPFPSHPLLDYETEEGGNTGEPEGEYEIVYEEPDLSGGVEGVDYGIVYGVGNEEEEEEE